MRRTGASDQDNYLDAIEWGGLTGTPTNLPSGDDGECPPAQVPVDDCPAR